MKNLNPIREQSRIVFVIWGFLALALLAALVTFNWSLAFIAVATFSLSLLPVFFANRFEIRLPHGFFAAVVFFIFGTIFLGEAFDFYERYGWWDVLLHGGSAVGFGLIGFIFVLMLFEGDRYAAPPWGMAFFAFCFAMTIGAVWEIFEFGMDQVFGLNMQKSGLVDTMADLMVDGLGALIGAAAGFAWLKGREKGSLTGQITQFVRENRGWFRRWRRK
ncbi:hypothetical protein [Halocynthiibacter styelae]|uniref:DUF2238 domain-containing protein n=1 Tax=Halocynthiibacter styelae TaxID=2761955 RepID=A0A8J7IEV1_9RHOB|nr:hypothetical protein [Paenihalocynthiibacter styelae]MBI1494127.1 hypothetical protein [Paenihalocynthiibacter styelae]